MSENTPLVADARAKPLALGTAQRRARWGARAAAALVPSAVAFALLASSSPAARSVASPAALLHAHNGHDAENLTIAEHAEIAEVLAILRDGFAAEIFCAGARFAYCSEATCKPAADSKVAYCWCKLEANATEGKFQINEASATLVRSATYRRAAVAARENRAAAARELLCGALRTGDIFREAGYNTRCAIAG